MSEKIEAWAVQWELVHSGESKLFLFVSKESALKYEQMCKLRTKTIRNIRIVKLREVEE